MSGKRRGRPCRVRRSGVGPAAPKAPLLRLLERRRYTQKRNGMTIRLIKLAVIYLVIGMTLGISMGITHDFLFRAVHAHVNLLGWASLALAGLVFHVFPDLARTRLATVWFWLYNLSM